MELKRIPLSLLFEMDIQLFSDNGNYVQYVYDKDDKGVHFSERGRVLAHTLEGLLLDEGYLLLECNDGTVLRLMPMYELNIGKLLGSNLTDQQMYEKLNHIQIALNTFAAYHTDQPNE